MSLGPGTPHAFLDLLDLEQVEQDIFRGWCHAGAPLRAFGGQVAAQALVAATRTVPDGRDVHSLHAYFLRPGRTDRPIVYLVDRTRDGGSFTTRRVIGVQDGENIFALSASFHRPEDGSEHQFSMPDVPGPDDLPPPPEATLERDEAWRAVHGMLDVRFVQAAGVPDPRGGLRSLIWARVVNPLPANQLLHACALTYLSDLNLAGTSLLPHLDEPSNIAMMASLDHAMWFHRPFRADEWLLFAQDSPSAAGARSLSRAEFFDRSGRLVASAVQEALVRRS